MRLSRGVLPALAALAGSASAQNVLRSSSLNSCQANSQYTASLFNVVFTTNNNSAAVSISAISSVEGSALFDISIFAYGYPIIQRTIDPCDAGLKGLCPMTSGKMDNPFNIQVSPDATSQIPGIAFSMPDLDARVKVIIHMTTGEQKGQTVACVEAMVSNGKTVDLLGVKWAAALVVIFALLAAAVMSMLGHLTTASHIAVNTLSLLAYYQSQAMLGLVAVPLPPVVIAWTQNFQWSLGVINIDFMQKIFTWYQRSTGGTPATLFDTLKTVSVQVVKRSLPMLESTTSLAKRANEQNGSGSYVVRGIQRVAFRGGIESTNLFMTCITFFSILIVFIFILVGALKGFCELAVKSKWVSGKNQQILDFRNGWRTILKGVLFRVALIGFPLLSIFCIWELTQRDSAAEVVLAVGYFLTVSLALGWATYKIIRMASRSISLHRNPAYILFSDPRILNKWGFLYIQFRASGYYFLAPVLGYIFVKSLFIALGQGSGIAQAIGFIIIEAAALITASVLRPWMDKSTNTFNIAICAVNFVNAVFLLIFTNVFDAPPLVVGAIGVVLWILNAATTLILLLLIIITTAIVFFQDNPDARFQYMADDRTSFMKSSTQLGNPELDALASTARGEKHGFGSGLDLDEDDELDAPIHHQPGARNSVASSTRRHPRSPVAGSFNDERRPATSHDHGSSSRSRPSTDYQRAPSPYNESSSSLPLPAAYRGQHNSSPLGHGNNPGNLSPSTWQRGAGYDH